MTFQDADSPFRKRSFEPDEDSFVSASPKKVESSFPSVSTIRITPPSPLRPIYPNSRPRPLRAGSLDKGSRPGTLLKPGMTVSGAPRPIDAHIPPLMSAFDETRNASISIDVQARNAPFESSRGEQSQTLSRPSTSESSSQSPTTKDSSYRIFHQPRGSTSTSNSESSDSSPTTTISTMDSSMAEASPAADESPATSNVSPVSYGLDPARFREPDRLKSMNPTPALLAHPAPSPFFELQRPSTPVKKPRNLKNLAVNTTGGVSLGRAISTAQFPLASQQNSAPASPAFVKPPSPPKRKNSSLGLTIVTSNTAGNPPPRLSIPPPTPSLKRPSLRHFQSSPSLPLYVPGSAPPGAPSFPALKREWSAPRGFAEILQEDEEEEPNFDVPQSREEKPESYPHGPICIYESGVDLYLEPTAEIASRYDVVVNVASEVKNPFDLIRDAQPPKSLHQWSETSYDSSSSFTATPADSRSSSISISGDSTQSSSPDTPKGPSLSAQSGAVSEALNALAGEVRSITLAEAEATPPTSSQRVEYIHIPWEHNTDIVPDLYRLVRIVDSRVQARKRVLIHCQCGVSRSASLIVAYGLYKNPHLSVQEAYDAVKKRSKWIGPNMNLIMQLQEFRSGLHKGRAGDVQLGLPPSRKGSAFGATGGRFSAGLGFPNTTPMLTAGSSMGASDRYEIDAAGSEPRTPKTCPLPPSIRMDQDDEMTRDQAVRASTGSLGVPLSAGQIGRGAVFWGDQVPGTRTTWTEGQVGRCRSFNDLSSNCAEMKVDATPTPAAPSATNVHVTTNEQTETFTLPLRTPDPTAQFFDVDESSSLDRLSLAPPKAVPNFSRQISLRKADVERASVLRSEPSRDDDVLMAGTDSFVSPSRSQSVSEPLASPRADEFHMTGFDHFNQDSQDVNDSFGILSPIRTEFPKNPFGEAFVSSFPRSPRSEVGMAGFSFAEPPRAPASNGFLQAAPRRRGKAASEDNSQVVEHPVPDRSLTPSPKSSTVNLSLGTTPSVPSLQTIQRPSSTIPVPGLPNSAGVALSTNSHSSSCPAPPPIPASHFTESPAPRLRPKFSSPSLKESVRLQKLQTTIAAAAAVPMEGDLDALQSPRAEWGTRNIWHGELPGHAPSSDPADQSNRASVIATGGGSPCSDGSGSTATLTAPSAPQAPAAPTADMDALKSPGLEPPKGFGFPDDEGHAVSSAAASTSTPQRDPRSPVMKGLSPIVRSIWDFL